MKVRGIYLCAENMGLGNQTSWRAYNSVMVLMLYFRLDYGHLFGHLFDCFKYPVLPLPGGEFARQARIAGSHISVINRYHRRMAIIEMLRRDLDSAAALFHSLSDPTRLSIVKRIAQGELRVRDLTSDLGLAQSTISAHIACLRDCQLVQGRNEGRSVYYSLTNPELMEMLAKAEILLAATGNAVGLCPNYGIETLEHQIKGIEKR